MEKEKKDIRVASAQLIVQVHNLLQRSKKSVPVINFVKSSVSGTKGGVSFWKGDSEYEGKVYYGEGRTRSEAKADIFDQISKYLEAEGAGGVSRAKSLNLLQSPPPKGKKTRRAKHRGEKGYENMKRKKMRAVFEVYKKGITKQCLNDNCGMLNFIDAVKCWDCKEVLEVATREVGERLYVFLDIERVAGNQESPPLSIGLVVMNERGEVEAEEEIFILPDGTEPRKNSYYVRIYQGMYVDFIKGMKVLKGGRERKVLPTVSPAAAAKELIAFLSGLSKSFYVFYHGPDLACLSPFLERNGLKKTCSELVDKFVDTQPFFKQVQGDRKFGMATIVNDWADEVIKKQYNQDKHSALVDARALGAVCFSKEIEKRFIDFAHGVFGDML